MTKEELKSRRSGSERNPRRWRGQSEKPDIGVSCCRVSHPSEADSEPDLLFHEMLHFNQKMI
jgi:hypothetical protein